MGAIATSTSNYSADSSADKAIDGIYPAAYPNIWHSGTFANTEHLDIRLAAAYELDSLTIYGRADGWSYRDIYNVFVYDGSGNLLFQEVGADATSGFVTITLPSSSPVPVPSAILLLGSGILGIAGVSRRK
jgi:hypothetical protein